MTLTLTEVQLILINGSFLAANESTSDTQPTAESDIHDRWRHMGGGPRQSVYTDLSGIVFVARVRLQAVFTAQRGRHVLACGQVLHHSVRGEILEAADVTGTGGDKGIAVQFPANRNRSRFLFRRNNKIFMYRGSSEVCEIYSWTERPELA